jgi:FMN reductase [NAD(P)H]
MKPTRFDLLGLDGPLNEVIGTLTAHASCRFLKPDPLPEGTLEQILVAAQSAPTSSNLQAWSVIAVTDPERKRRLAELCGGQRMVRDCPVFLIFCPDTHRLRYVCERQGREFGAVFLEMFLLASVDAALAAQNAAVAAESLGLGTCMCGSIRNNPVEVIELLDLPEGVYALTGLCLGYPAVERLEVKARLPLRSVLHRERYSDEHLVDAVAEYDRTMAEGRTYDGRRVSIAGEPTDRDYGFYGWAEHTARRLSRPETIAASASLRENLRKVLEGHGWSFK